ncbi:hypothetical protein H0W26_01875, partial [Candidatus Dependentiae bacterium]|nr:hypothetical protein [Candidatus Dependentiae bacterium]
MNTILKAALIVGLFFSLPHAFGMQRDLNAEKDQQETYPFLEEVDRAALYNELRACLDSRGRSVNPKDFTRLLNNHPWLVDYVGLDGLTIGEVIVTICKKEYDKEQRDNNSTYRWLIVSGPTTLLDFFELLITVLKQNST